MRTLFLYDFRRSPLATTSLVEDGTAALPGNGLVSTPLEQAAGTAGLRQTCPRLALPDVFSSSVWSIVVNRRLDFLWVAISIGLALFTWQYAVREAYTPIWLYVALNIQCAVLFALRHPAQLTTRDPLEVGVTLVSLNYIFAFEPIPIVSSAWAPLGGVICTVGAFLTLISVHSLGRSFAVLPSLRPIKTSGSYRFVRHPIYLSYLVTALGIVIRHPSIYNGAVALVGIMLVLWRIKFEDRLLAQEPSYREYVARVHYQLIPGLY
jgi:protein-S-isoprenylcysteine O-methyltransferase Ste14